MLWPPAFKGTKWYQKYIVYQLIFIIFLETMKPSLIHDVQFPIDLCPVPDGGHPFFCRFKGRQIQGFQQGGIARKYASLTVQHPVSEV